MTAALLLARRRHTVSIWEAGERLGGLWASKLDADGFFRSDNSCKVFQASYTTVPALFARMGMDWREHFHQRHDLGSDWLRPFIADSSWLDLGKLGRGLAAHLLGLGRPHELSVDEYLTTRGLSEGCSAWMRASALGGVAGTLRMTMWELFHRIQSNLSEIFKGARGPLYWNAQPPSARGGFLGPWQAALEDAGVEVHTRSAVRGLDGAPGSRGATLRLGDSESVVATAVFLALPPPALQRLLLASPEGLAEGFGFSRQELDGHLEESVYSHVGMTWFFDRELPRDLPLGGHNVRRGWHPILVQHDQYRAHLRPPAVSAVVGSVAVDTDLAHQRLGTRASAHTPRQLAEIIWRDEQQVDPELPDPMEIVIHERSSATQIVRRGPLPMAMAGRDIYLATNLHGQAPYFTASLESAVQAGALAAQCFDPGVERLPMSPPNRLPWRQPAEGSPRDAPERRHRTRGA